MARLSGEGSTSSLGSARATKARAKDAGANGARKGGKGNRAERDVLRATRGPMKRVSTKSTSRLKSKQKSKSKSESKPKMAPGELLLQAEEALTTGRPGEALPIAARALAYIQPHGSSPTTASLPVFNLIGQIYLELGKMELARQYFLQAVDLDLDGTTPESQGGGAEKFLWLAQLSENGGQDSIDWFERGAQVLRNDISALGEGDAAREKRNKLADALCGIVETYMTDLALEDDAEEKCESYVAEALLVAPQSPVPLKTLASIRISQGRNEEAKTALINCIELWKDLPSDDAYVPSFPERISLSRLLIEAEMEVKALEFLTRLTSEDDRSIEAWYLGGWGLYLLGYKPIKVSDDVVMHDETQDQEKGQGYHISWLIESRKWLRESLRLYDAVRYEDHRLRAHARELVAQLDKVLGESNSGDMEDEGVEDESEGEGEDGDGDEDDEEEDDEDEEMGDT